jgi:hypothetical protein
MICAVALMLGIWVVVTLSIALPLMVAFAPVVMLPALMVPVALFICLQKSLKAMKQLFHVDKEVEKLGDMTKPVPFVETVFVLKAATTQLISVAVLCFLFLPLYELGFSWWKEGASLFLFENFDLPSLRFRFTYSLSWPHFEQPRLGIQLALGIFLIGTHSILKITKRLLILHQELVNFENIHPGYFEELVINVFSQCSWRPFRSPMDGAQTSFEAVPSLGHTRFVMWFYGYADEWDIKPYSKRPNKRKACLTECLIMTVVGIPLYVGAFCYYLFLPDNRIKHFGMGTNDQDVLDFANSEESMGYKGAQFDEGCNAKNHSVLFYRCPWLRVSNFVSSLFFLIFFSHNNSFLFVIFIFFRFLFP